MARALGVSVSTVKRWVDAGELRACRTVGRHRMIAPSEVLRFARGRRMPTAALENLVGTARCEGGPEALAAALRRGRAGEAWTLILSASADGRDAAGLADEWICPAMEQIGREWEAGALDVFQEHRATRIVEMILGDLIRRSPAPAVSRPPLALGASAEGDLYTLPGLLAEVTLRELGWDVVNLGPNLPLASMARAVRAHRPELAWLSAHHLADAGRFLAEYPVFFAAASEVGTAVIVGGRAFEGLQDRIACTRSGQRMADLRELARHLQAAAPGADPATPEPPGPASS